MLLTRKEKPKNSYDVIVIGSGLGGLTAANILAKHGRSVLLLESHNKLGGLATWFKRQVDDGHGGIDEKIFDISLHGFPYGMVKTCRRYWSKEIADRIVPIKKVRFKNPQFDIESEFTESDTLRILVEKFKVGEEQARGFFAALNGMNFYDQDHSTIGDLFQRFFPDRNDIIRFLLEPITYANGSTLEDPAIAYGIVFSNFMSRGVYIFNGGTDLMISMMKEELIKNGVDIKLHSKVDRILTKSEQSSTSVDGVELDGQIIQSKVVVSNAHLLSTIFKLIDPKIFSQDFLKQAKAVRPNTSSCQVYMALKKGETIPFMGDLIFTSHAKDFTTNMLLSPKVEGQTFSFYYPDMREHRSPATAIVSSSNARYDDWQNLSVEEYEKRKQYLIERAVEDLEKLIPGIREKIDYVEAATPNTFERFTHHPNGASFGTKFEGLEVSKNLSKEVVGLYHAGSVGIIMSGWLGAANYGVIQANAAESFLIDQDNLKANENIIGSQAVIQNGPINLGGTAHEF